MNTKIEMSRNVYCNVSKCLLSNRILDTVKMPVFATFKNSKKPVNAEYSKI